MRARVLFAVFALVACSAASVVAAPRTKTAGNASSPAPAAPPPSTPGMRAPVANELTELARTALASSMVRVPKGATLLAARPSVMSHVEIPIAPSRVTIDLTPLARRAGPVTATAVLVFWKDSDISARLPLHLDFSVPAEALVYDVPKGSVLTLVVRRGLVEVSTQAVTSADADLGDIVQVLLRPSGRALRGQLVARDRAIAVEDGR